MHGEELLRHCEALNRQALYSSAASLTSFLLVTHNLEWQVYSTYAASLFGQGEYKRAVSAYQTALDMLPGPADSAEVVDLRWKLAECHAKAGNHQLQLYTLTGIPIHVRSPAVHMALGHLFLRMSNDREALASFHNALAACPLALEAAQPLARLGMKEEDIVSLVASQLEEGSWVIPYLQGLIREARSDYKGGLQAYGGLTNCFGESCEVLRGMAVCQAETGQVEEAARSFDKIRSKEDHFVQDMDCYAHVLRTAGEAAALNKLTNSLLETDSMAPQAWVAASLYSELNSDGEHALEYAEKALNVDSRHACALVRCGTIHLESERFDLALVSFRKALEVERGIRAYQGTVRAYIGMGRIKEALNTAKEGLQHIPHSPRAFTLVGLAMSQLPEGLDKARLAFEKARQLDPYCTETVMELVNVLVQHDLLADCVQVLQAALQLAEKGFLHSRLGDIYAKLHRYPNALSEYHKALALNQNLECAKTGLERLEKLMKGVDPDDEGEVVEEDREDMDGFGTPSYNG